MESERGAAQRLIYNCHTHVFTAQQVPPNALPLGIVRALNHPPTAKRVAFWLRKLDPFLDVFFRNFAPLRQSGMVGRLAAFLELSDATTTAEVFSRLADQYPNGTRFVLLPIDMDFMNAGSAKRDYLTQLEDLRALKGLHPETALPFVCADPRREGVTELVRSHVLAHGFAGIKLYPALGFYPSDPRLDGVYAFAEEYQVPIITHCSKGGIRLVGERHPQQFTAPIQYIEVLKRFPKLKLCLAHFGGDGEWAAYLQQARHLPMPEQTWVSQIINLLYNEHPRHPNLYTDISYTASNREVMPMLKVLVNDPKLRERILFGSDFFVVRQEVTEREFSIRMRGFLGEEDFWQIANTNPTRFLRLERPESP